uniref:Uncharacterized protein n=1 Tax=Candidatus Kentrum sp. TC TaxID=2126339 RepID=A0A450YXI9_9GAMM|nr:MAG: hypothetical protein BECKTC1821E_GA0114239_106213 [Candidatus Kentron sp. TC]VFK49261.1 MAG: hypothetical protein BECKTC1821D_GA0114238_107311 [Candidatus Kentron sp. TC]
MRIHDFSSLGVIIDILMVIYRKREILFLFNIVTGKVLVGLLLILSTLSNVALAKEQSACMIVKHHGDVSLAIGGGNMQSIKNFVTLRNGDRLLLAQGGEVKLVCFGILGGGAGRVETWFGPVTLVVNEEKTYSTGKQAIEIQTLPIGPDFSRYAIAAEDQPAAVLTLRTIPRAASIANIVDDYCHLRLEAPMENLVPEHYLFSSLREEGLIGKFNGWLKGVARRESESSCLTKLISTSSSLLSTLRQ